MLIKQGLLIVNLGTPASTSKKDIKNFLSALLSDRHVVDVNPLVWKPLLHGLVIPKRLKYIAEHYQSILVDNELPLSYYSRVLADKLSKEFPHMQCELAMTYGEPSLANAINKLRTCTTIHVLSLYPQFSTTTTLPVINRIKKLTKNWRYQYKFNYLYDYAAHQSYINALVKHIDDHICINQPDVLFLSYHGIPVSYIEKRHDDYVNRCVRTSKLIENQLKLIYPNLKIEIVYQSTFGKSKWIEPNTTDVLIECAKQKKSVAVFCPGFAVDCIETLYEIDIENREYFLLNGGEEFQYIPALNDEESHVEMLKAICLDLFKMQN